MQSVPPEDRWRVPRNRPASPNLDPIPPEDRWPTPDDAADAAELQVMLFPTYADFVKRALAYLIDRLVVGVPLAMIGALLKVILSPTSLGTYTMSGVVLARTHAPLGPALAASALSVLAFTVYDAWCLAHRAGQTIGKYVCHLRVTSADGSAISTAQAWGRTLVKVMLPLTFVVLGGLANIGVLPWIGVLGFLWVIWDTHKQAWHDKAADTCVVQE